MPNIDKSAVLDVTLRRTHWARQILKTYAYIVTLTYDGTSLEAIAHPRLKFLTMRFRRWEGRELRSSTYRSFVREIWDMIERRPKRESNGSSQAPVADSATEKKYPTLLSYLQDDRFADGTSRTRSTVTIFVKDSQFRASLNDRDADEVLWAAGDTLEGLLKALEASLRSPDAVWHEQRTDRPGTRRKKPKST